MVCGSLTEYISVGAVRKIVNYVLGVPIALFSTYYVFKTKPALTFLAVLPLAWLFVQCGCNRAVAGQETRPKSD
jgi:ABC-type spermidine/putrescine transport system permease subunit II